jgi:hypothetical protein
MRVNMLASAFVAVSSSTAAAFVPKTRLAFKHAATRSYSRSAMTMMAHPKGR